MARILVACESSGTVRRAFARRGHDAWSCDLEPAADRANKHIVGDVRDILNDGWDMLAVMHPPCTRLCNSGVRWLSVPPPGRTLPDMWNELDEGAALFSACWNAPIEHICVENPVMHKHAKERIEGYEAPAQSVQPWQFGHAESKRTCFWLKGLPALVPTYRTWEDCRRALRLADDAQPEQRVHKAPPGADRWKERSRFFDGIAEAMADQWAGLLPDEDRRMAA
jgi:hypothetical protein